MKDFLVFVRKEGGAGGWFTIRANTWQDAQQIALQERGVTAATVHEPSRPPEGFTYDPGTQAWMQGGQGIMPNRVVPSWTEVGRGWARGADGGEGEGKPPVVPLPPTDPLFSEAEQPFAAFTRGVREAGLPLEGLIGERLRGRAEPLEALIRASAAAGTRDLYPAGTENAFQRFTRQYAGDPQAARNLALSSLQNIAGFTDEGAKGDLTGRAEFFNPVANVQGGFLQRGGGTGQSAFDIMTLLQDAIAAKTNPFLASATAGGVQRRFLRDFEENALPGGQDFGAFARERLKALFG